MKKLLSLILVAMLSIGAIACSGNSVASSNALTKKIEKICQKEIFKIALDGKKINEAMKEAIEKMSDSEIKQAQENLPDLSFDISNFNSESSTYTWLADAVKKGIKKAIDTGSLKQENVDQLKGYLTLMGISLPDIKVDKGLSDIDIDKLCEAFADVADRITEPETLKAFGIDLSNPEIINSLRKSAGF